MSWSDKDYVKLLIWRPQSGAARWLIAMRATADYYGWTEQFEAWTPKTLFTQGGREFMTSPSRRGRMYCEGGRRHKISRDPSKRGKVPGLTNQFKVSESCTLFDLAEVAYLTQVDWHWMSAPTGERLSRDQWLRMHEAGTRRNGRGLVSV